MTLVTSESKKANNMSTTKMMTGIRSNSNGGGGNGGSISGNSKSVTVKASKRRTELVLKPFINPPKFPATATNDNDDDDDDAHLPSGSLSCFCCCGCGSSNCNDIRDAAFPFKLTSFTTSLLSVCTESSVHLPSSIVRSSLTDSLSLAKEI